jgi:osomolarity two-component system sensor histidine kinase TcsA
VLIYAKQMERIFALAPVPTIVLDPSFHILEVSQTYLDILHARVEDCRGLDFFNFVTEKTSASNLPVIRKIVEDAVAAKSTQSTNVLPGSDGQKYWRLSAVPIVRASELLYLVLEARDATKEYLDRQALNSQLAAAEIYRVLVNTVKDYAIFMLDIEGHVATWNAGAAILKQYSQEEIIGKHFSEFYSEEDRKARKPEKELQWALRDGKVEDEGWRIRKDGSRFWANVIMSPIYQDSVLTGFSKVTRDLTERKAAEGRLIAAYEEASRMKSDFLANMSHEIRTPMHGMLSALSLLMDTSLTTEQQELTGIIEESGSILLQVINDILDYSKLTSGSFSITTGVINIADIVDAVRRCFEVGSKAALRFDVEHDPRLPVFAHGDPLRYRQILQNLVSNAIKFTDEGYVRVTTILSCEDEMSYTVKSEVIDTGIGVPPQAVSSLFNPFTQLDNFVTKRYKGTGLGLSICKSLAELMGGAIGYRPNPERHGSIFYFTMKLAKLENSTPHPLPVVVPSADIKAVALNKQLLLIEDNAINQTIMVRLLSSFGFEKVDVAGNGAEGVQLVKQKPLTYDLLLMDISMPVLDGVSATNQIRQMGLDVPIIAMTANALKGDAELYLAKGMNGYIAKPVDRRLLLQALLRWLG